MKPINVTCVGFASMLGLTLVFTLGSWTGNAGAQNAASQSRAVSALQSRSPQRWICSADPNGTWREDPDPCSKEHDGLCRAHCTRIPPGLCTPPVVAAAIHDCAGRTSCTPLVLHRRLDKLGCQFDSDTFWVPVDAKPKDLPKKEIEAKLNEHPGKAVIQWDRGGCTRAEREEIERDLKMPPSVSHTSGGRHAAFVALLKRGCNVALDGVGADGPYQQAHPVWDAPGSADPSGVAPQPHMYVWFFGNDGGVTNPPSAPLTGELSACAAFEALREPNRLIRCEPSGDDGGVRIRFLGENDSAQPPTELAKVEAPTCPGCAVATSTIHIQPLPISGVIGSAGAGAALAAISRWAFVRIKRKRSDGEFIPEPATHDSASVHVLVGFRERPRIRSHWKDRTSDGSPPSTDHRQT